MKMYVYFSDTVTFFHIQLAADVTPCFQTFSQHLFLGLIHDQVFCGTNFQPIRGSGNMPVYNRATTPCNFEPFDSHNCVTNIRHAL